MWQVAVETLAMCWSFVSLYWPNMQVAAKACRFLRAPEHSMRTDYLQAVDGNLSDTAVPQKHWGVKDTASDRKLLPIPMYMTSYPRDARRPREDGG